MQNALCRMHNIDSVMRFISVIFYLLSIIYLRRVLDDDEPPERPPLDELPPLKPPEERVVEDVERMVDVLRVVVDVLRTVDVERVDVVDGRDVDVEVGRAVVVVVVAVLRVDILVGRAGNADVDVLRR